MTSLKQNDQASCHRSFGVPGRSCGAELLYVTESELESHPLRYSQKEIQENAHSAYKLWVLGQIEQQYIMKDTYSLKDLYMCIFQPEPSLDYYSKGLPNRDRSHLGPLGARVHAASGNFLADYLALNSVQFATLQHEIIGTDNEFCPTYILPTQLPIPGTEPDKARITLPLSPYPTMRIPSNPLFPTPSSRATSIRVPSSLTLRFTLALSYPLLSMLLHHQPPHHPMRPCPP